MTQAQAEAKATEMFPRGCQCPNNGAVDCEWCEAVSIALDSEEETKWTPGPWQVGTYRNRATGEQHLAVWDDRIQVGSVGNPVCLISPIDKRNARDEANANLIAAVPEMFSALERADGLLTQCLAVLANEAITNHLPYGLKEQVREFVVGCTGTHAIRKARGEVNA